MDSNRLVRVADCHVQPILLDTIILFHTIHFHICHRLLFLKIFFSIFSFSLHMYNKQITILFSVYIYSLIYIIFNSMQKFYRNLTNAS